ncbi:MAG: pirin family protein [Candidatus Thorarchaeota archaeon]
MSSQKTLDVRRVLRVIPSTPTIEGAGVRLKRAFAEKTLFDPFLLLDDFHSDNPDDYVKGFPTHPHRGIETVTYMLHGEMKHEDSLGNAGVIQPGDVQWMTAGSGIIHSEMPFRQNGLLWGFQLWCNLPAAQKMMSPRYQDILAEQIPTITLENQTEVKVISGQVNGTQGPVKDIVTDPEYLDVAIPPFAEFNHQVKKGYTVFAYVIEGSGYFDDQRSDSVKREYLVMFRDGDQVTVRTEDDGVRFLLISGKPIGEPVAWYGPIVMNTQQELNIAFEEYRRGTFLKHDPSN